MASTGTKERGPHALSTQGAPPTISDKPEKFWPEPASSAPRGNRTRKLPWKKLTLIVLLIAVLGGLYGLYRAKASAAGDESVQLFTVTQRSFPVVLKERGELKANNSIDIRSELEGRATIIYLIPEGSRVKEGELLLELASDTIDNSIRDAESKEASALAAYEAAVKTRDIERDENASKIRKAQLQLRLAQLADEKYKQGEQKEFEQDATLAVDKAQMVRDRKDQDFKDTQELFGEGFVTRVDLKDAEFQAYAAKLDLDKAKLALEVLKKYTIPMALEEKASDVHEAEKELDRERKAAEAAESKSTADVGGKKSELDIVRDKLAKLRDQKKKSKIHAPAAGLVIYARENSWRTENTIDTGVEVHERQLLLQLPDTSQMKVEARVHEAQIERMQVGMPAMVSIEGFEGRMFSGKVAKIAVMADSQNYFLNPNLREYKTDILLDGTYTELKPNTTARVEIQVAQLNNVLAVPIQTVFAKAGRFYVFADADGQTRPVHIQPGLSSSEYVEVKSGLTPGQKIRLNLTDEMKLHLPDDAAGSEDADGKPDAARRRGKTSVEAIQPKATRPAPASGPADAAPGPQRKGGRDGAKEGGREGGKGEGGRRRSDNADKGGGAPSSQPAGSEK